MNRRPGNSRVVGKSGNVQTRKRILIKIWPFSISTAWPNPLYALSKNRFFVTYSILAFRQCLVSRNNWKSSYQGRFKRIQELYYFNSKYIYREMSSCDHWDLGIKQDHLKMAITLWPKRNSDVFQFEKPHHLCRPKMLPPF